jgi:hypothetical protein
VATGNIVADMPAVSQPTTQLTHQSTSFFQAGLIFEPLHDCKAGDFRYGALPSLRYRRQLLILLGRQLERDGDCGHRLISLRFSPGLTGV